MSELRDTLAVRRTEMANERTFLAYIRTALALFITGGGLIEFFDSRILNVIAWIVITFGAVALIIGARRFLKLRRELKS